MIPGGTKGPVIASVSLSLQKNVVLTTTPCFSAAFLLENSKAWLPTFPNAKPHRAPDPQCPLEYIDYHHLYQYYSYLYRPASSLAVLL